MKTTMTLGEIRNVNPSPESWKKLIISCGTLDDAHVVDLRDILRSNGPRDAWWATECLPLKERKALRDLATKQTEFLILIDCDGKKRTWKPQFISPFEAVFDSIFKVTNAVGKTCFCSDIFLDEIVHSAFTRFGKILHKWCDEQDAKP
jgi:hypothetical protein